MKMMPMKMMLLLIVVAEMIIIPAPTPPNVRPNVNVCYRCIYPGVFLTVRFPRKELSPKLQTNRKPRKQNATRIERMVKYVSETENRTQKHLCPREYSSLIKSKLLQSQLLPA
jgi:hypothetical protein